jgi:hypothetical protein
MGSFLHGGMGYLRLERREVKPGVSCSKFM